MSKVYPNLSKKDGAVISYSTVAFIGTQENGEPYQKKVTVKVADLPPGTPETPKKQLAAAEKALDDRVTELKADYERTRSKTDKRSITLHAFITDHWIPDKVKNGKKSPNTISFYEDQSKPILDYFRSNLKLSSIGTEEIIKFNNYQRNEAKKQNGDPISQSTAAHRFATLRAILGYAYRTGYIRQNPCDGLDDDDKITQQQNDVDFLNAEQLESFVKMLERYSKESGSLFWQTYFSIALYAGLRRGEIIALQWKDVVSINGKPFFSVEKNAVRNPNVEGKVEIRKPKNGKPRLVPIHDDLNKLIEAYKAEQETKGTSTLPAAYVFPRESNPAQPIYTTTPTQRLSKMEKKYGLSTDASPHDLRHSLGSALSRNKVPLKTISKLLGHSDIRTTERYYIGTDAADMSDAVDTIKIG